MIKNNKNNFCPCCSNNPHKKLYRDCCGLFISGEQIPSTPEKLMRSRYTAYVRGDLAYVQKTMMGEPLESFDPEETQKFIDNVKWQELRVLKNFSDPENLENPENSNKAYVEFSAIYKVLGKRYEIHETSEFLKQNGQWFYNGELEEPGHACEDNCGHEH